MSTGTALLQAILTDPSDDLPRLAYADWCGAQYLTREELAEYPTGCIVAVCQLTACFRLADLDRLGERLATVGLTIEQVRQHEHAEGPWCWLLQDVRRLEEPVPCRGAQGLWEWGGLA